MRHDAALLAWCLAISTGISAAAGDSLPDRVLCRFAETGAMDSADPHLERLCALLRRQRAITTLPPDVHVTLVIDTLSPDLLRAHLDWASPAGNGSGPTMEFGFLDVEFSPQHYLFVLGSLLNATNIPIIATNGG